MSMTGERRINMGKVNPISSNRLTTGILLGNNFNVIITRILPNMLAEIEYLVEQIIILSV